MCACIFFLIKTKNIFSEGYDDFCEIKLFFILLSNIKKIFIVMGLTIAIS